MSSMSTVQCPEITYVVLSVTKPPSVDAKPPALLSGKHRTQFTFCNCVGGLGFNLFLRMLDEII